MNFENVKFVGAILFALKAPMKLRQQILHFQNSFSKIDRLGE
jgi:hypothetical protein